MRQNANRGSQRAAALWRRNMVDLVEADHADAVAGRLDDEARMREVMAVVERLPRRQRDVLELVAWSGLTTAQAAAALDVPEGTVTSRLSLPAAGCTSCSPIRKGACHER